MPFLNGYERPAAGGRDLAASFECCFNDRAIRTGLDDPRAKRHSSRHRSRAFENDMKICGDCAGRSRYAGLLHQMMRRGPVAVAIEQRSADPSVEHIRKRLMMFLRGPRRDELVSLDETTNSQPLLISRTAAKAAVVRSESFLKARCHARILAASR